jgi:hypothetical protein
MNFFNFVGAVSGCSAIVGFLAVVVRLGEWKARLEERVATHRQRLESVEAKQNSSSVLLHKNNELLAEIKVKVDLMYAGKSKRGKYE